MSDAIAPSLHPDLALERSIPADLIGTWRLIGIDERGPDGVLRPLCGESPLGYLLYDATGLMSVQIMNPERLAPGYALPSGPLPADQRDALAAVGYIAYFGRYSWDPASQTMHHTIHGSLYPGDVGRVEARSLAFEGERLVLSRGPVAIAWERLRTEHRVPPLPRPSEGR